MQSKMKRAYSVTNEGGFTLIEIIAVLIILGILVAVAVPRYMDLVTEAHQKAVDGALAALQSTATMDYSRNLLQSPSVTTYTPSNGGTASVGDFSGTIAIAAGVVTVTVTGGPSWWNSSIAGNSKSFRLY
jgi:prepilin-type N-terminal cleavage/methylation domain-containing protein